MDADTYAAEFKKYKAHIAHLEATLSAAEFEHWLSANRFARALYIHCMKPIEPEQVITSETTLIEAFPLLAKWVADYRARTAPLYNTYRPNGAATYGL